MISILKLVELGGLHSAGCLYDIFSQHLDFFRSFSNSFRFLLKVGGACNHDDMCIRIHTSDSCCCYCGCCFYIFVVNIVVVCWWWLFTWKMQPVCESLVATWLPVSSVCIHLNIHLHIPSSSGPRWYGSANIHCTMWLSIEIMVSSGSECPFAHSS